MAAKYHRRAHANLANQQDCLRAGIWWRGGRICIKAEWRHDDRINGIRRKRRRSCGVRFLAVGLHGMPEGSDFSGNWGTSTLHAGSREIAGARGSVAVKRIDLTARQIYNSALRHDE